MDEQQIQDYLNLIQQLLNCSTGQEMEILHANSLLIDEGFVREMEQVASTAGEDEINVANWLRKLSAQLADAIRNWSKLNQQVIELYNQGNYARAVIIAEQALELAQFLWGERHPNLATSLNNLAAIYKYQGCYNESELLYDKALATNRELLGEENLDVATSMNNLATLYDLQGRYSEAETLVLNALAIRKCLLGEEHCDIANSIANLAAIHESQGKYNEAEEEHKKALEMRKRLLIGEEHLDVALSLNNLALIYYCQGRYSEAEPYYKEALAIYQKLKQEEHPDIATILNNLGTIYSAQKQYKEAEKFYIKALAIRKRLLDDKHPNIATSLNNLATLYLKNGRYFEAEQKYKESLEIYRSRGEAHQSANILNNLASVYYLLNLYSLAESFLIEALAIRKSLLGERHADIALSLNNLAEIYGCQGHYNEAEAYYLKGLEMTKDLLGSAHPNVSNYLHNFAGLLTITNRPTEALEKMWEATEVDERIIRRVFATSSEQGRLINLQTIRNTLDILLSLVLNHLTDSAEAKRTALNVVLKRKSLTATALAVQNEALYSGRYSHLGEQFKKLRSLNEQIIDLIYSLPKQQQLSVTRQHLTELEDEADKLQRQLASEVKEIQLQEQLVNCRIVASELPKGSALVEFVRFDVFNFTTSGRGQWHPPRYIAFILLAGQPESVQIIDIGEAEYIDSLIRDFLEVVSRKGTNQKSQLGMVNKGIIHIEYPLQAGIKLRQAIFDKLRPYLKKEHQHLFIAPDGELNLVPFQILPSDDTREKMLMDEFTISYLTVGRDILRQKIDIKRPVSVNALVFASPNFDLIAENITPDATTQEQNTQPANLRQFIANKPLKAATGTDILGERIAQKLKVMPYLGSEALQSYFNPRQCPRILLIATHGVFLPKQPEDPSLTSPYQDGESDLLGRERFSRRVENPMLRSALALAGANTWAKGGKLPLEAGKGILFAQDVAGLDLWANEISILSACETGIGDVAIDGEGVFGLRRAFTVAGAKTLIMSLWSVNGWATALLMERFFDNCEAGLGRAAALQEAQNNLRNITVGELQQFELGREILKHQFNKGRELDAEILARQAKDKPLAHPYYWGAWICQGDTTPLPFTACS
jgi:CHAT domain-containing protein